MKREALTRWSPVFLGIVYVLLGVAETVRLLVTGDGGFLFWFGTLVGGGSLLLAGSLPRETIRGGRRQIAVVSGALLGVPATAWTVLVPVVALTVVVLTLSGTPDPRDPAQRG